MKVLYLGDFKKKNGPSMVDINLTNKLDKKVIKVQIDKNYKSTIKHIKSVDIVNISGVSMKGCIYSIISKIMRKKITYIMHGGIKIEKQYRSISKYRSIYENIIISLADKVICVSEKYENLVKKVYNINKTLYINNGVNIDINKDENVNRDNNTIITVGGGRREKGVLNICKSIQLIDNNNIKLIVAGEDSIDTDEIKSYDFVDYKGFISNNELLKLMNSSSIFIQNSYCESFGIAPIEAIQNGCKIIVSENVGVPIKGIDEFVVKTDNIYELKQCIEKLIVNRDTQQIDLSFINDLTWDKASDKYLALWNSMI